MARFEQQAINMTLGQLATNEVLEQNILKLLIDVPREDFVPAPYRHAAYIDQDIEIGKNRFMLAPLTFARLLKIADVTESCRVLVIGAGTGYEIAVLAELAGHVVGIDDDGNMVAQALQNITKLGIKDTDIEQVKNIADGYQLSAPYDVIFINGGIEYLPEDLSEQLSIGGRLVAVLKPTKSGGKGILVKRFEGKTNIRECFDASTAILQGFAQRKPFIL